MKQHHLPSKVPTIGVECVRRHVQLETKSKQEIDFEEVHLCCAYSSYLGIVCIVVVHIVHELGSNQDTSNDQPMNIPRIYRHRRLPLHEPIQINIRDNETRRATIRILKDPLKITMDRDGGTG